MCEFKECIFVVLMLLSALVSSFEHRSRRFLTFPPTAPTRVQVNFIENYNLHSILPAKKAMQFHN